MSSISLTFVASSLQEKSAWCSDISQVHFCVNFDLLNTWVFCGDGASRPTADCQTKSNASCPSRTSITLFIALHYNYFVTFIWTLCALCNGPNLLFVINSFFPLLAMVKSASTIRRLHQQTISLFFNISAHIHLDDIISFTRLFNLDI